MVFKKLTLHNFGAFKNRQSIDLEPESHARPIVLIGGLNGAGKTTLLEALQLVLYGKLASSRSKTGQSYEEYLRGCIHRSVAPEEGAGIKLLFEHTASGRTWQYELTRTWRSTGKRIKESFEVVRDGQEDKVLSQEWDQYVEELIPSRLAPLFFFDGEKVEELAEFDETAKVLSVAIHSLLGIALVDQLAQDLQVFDRRKSLDQKNPEEKLEIKSIQTELRHAEDREKAARSQTAKCNNEQERAKKKMYQADKKFKDEGGHFFEHREELEQQTAEARARLRDSENRLRDFAAGPAPLALVQDLIESLAHQSEVEVASEQDRLFHEVIEERDEEVLKRVRELQVSQENLERLRAHLESDRSARRLLANQDAYLNLGSEVSSLLAHLFEKELGEIRLRTRDLLSDQQDRVRNLEDHERRLTAIPDEGTVAHLVKQREERRKEYDEARARHAVATEGVEREDGIVQQLKVRLEVELKKRVEAELASKDVDRLLLHTGKVQKTLELFRLAVLENHAERIQELVLDGFTQLVRKDDLITSVRIDPIDFSLTLFGADGKDLAPDRLSAGERQLLAVAVLWGLARASGRPIPTIVDTPLGRLDSTHRKHLISRYFPNASHQVILLSTDEEIINSNLQALKPSIGKSYLLEYAAAEDASTIEPGYFN